MMIFNGAICSGMPLSQRSTLSIDERGDCRCWCTSMSTRTQASPCRPEPQRRTSPALAASAYNAERSFAAAQDDRGLEQVHRIDIDDPGRRELNVRQQADELVAAHEELPAVLAADAG